MVVPWNPCGAICDYADAPYTTTMRPFADSDVEVPIIWYPARADAPVLPYPSCFTSRINYGEDDWLYQGPGEVYGAERVANLERRKLGARGTHQCGTREQFAGLATFDPDAVPIVYDSDGLPLCCGAARPGRGGGAGGGDSLVTYFSPAPVPGDTCATAGVIEIGTEYVWTSAGETAAWFIAPAVPDEQYYLVAECHPDFGTLGAFLGFGCGAGIGFQFSMIASSCLDFVPSNVGFEVKLLFEFTLPGEVYTFKIGVGTCPP